MSSLPEQEAISNEQMYSGSEVRHLLAREVMKYRMDDAMQRIGDLETNTAAMFAKVNESLNTIRELVSKRGDDTRHEIEDCRERLEADIADKYATKTDVEKLRGEVRVVGTMVTIGVVVAVFFINLGFSLWGR